LRSGLRLPAIIRIVIATPKHRSTFNIMRGDRIRATRTAGCTIAVWRCAARMSSRRRLPSSRAWCQHFRLHGSLRPRNRLPRAPHGLRRLQLPRP
jgi:hypothetical protein